MGSRKAHRRGAFRCGSKVLEGSMRPLSGDEGIKPTMLVRFASQTYGPEDTRRVPKWFSEAVAPFSKLGFGEGRHEQSV